VTQNQGIGLIDQANMTLESAEFNIPLTVVSGTYGTAEIVQSLTAVCPGKSYALSFYIGTNQPLSSLDFTRTTISNLQDNVAAQLNSTWAALLPDIASIPLTELGHCVVNVIQDNVVVTSFSLSVDHGAATTISPLPVLNGASQGFTRYDVHVTGGAGPSSVGVTFVCPQLALSADITTGQASQDTSNSGLTTASNVGNLISALGVSSITLYVDQVALDFFAPP
jgi:hypothetical protein